MIHSYPSVYALGHKAIEGIFSHPVLVEEKIDGSQFSMCKTAGVLECRSKGKQLVLDNPEKMFLPAIETAQDLDLHDGWVYRCEFLGKPKHNTIAYERVPAKFLIVFDICDGLESYLPYSAKKQEAERLGLECVPIMYEGVVESPETFMRFLDTMSCLGGSKIEGVVCKNYTLQTAEKKAAMGKYVSEAFKEAHKIEWGKSNPTQGDIIEQIIRMYKTDARWQKSVQHLRERGELKHSPQDIGPLMKEVVADIAKECGDEIRDMLWSHFWAHIRRGVCGGLPEWYKGILVASAFEKVQP